MSYCNLDKNDNELEILYRQLKREVAELVKTTNATLLKHDGKIAELCLYIKANLSNTIRDLLDTMLTSGEIDQIVIETITNLEPMLSQIGKDVDSVKKYVFDNMIFYLPNGASYTYGQFVALGLTKTKACLFDTGYPNDAKENLDYLRKKLNGKKLDYVFISHYHADHTGGLKEFKELYDANTKFYIAKNIENYYTGSELEGAVNDRANVINFLTSNRYQYTEINEDIRIKLEDGISLKLMNNTDDSFSYYKLINTDNYNNYSLVIDCEIFNKHVLLGFDAQEHAQTYLLSKNQVNKTDVLFNFHHGNYNKCDREYMLKLNPDIVIDTLPPANLDDFDGTEASTERPLYNAKLISNARNEVILNVNSFEVEIEKGDVKVDSIRNNGTVEVYLNPDYNGNECIGTATKPFKTINQIFELIPKSCQSVTINVSGTKMLTNQRINNVFDKLIIKGNANNKTKFTNIQLDNCKKVEFSNIKFTENTVYLFNSDVRFTDCEFDAPKEENLNITNSKVSCTRCDFKNSTRQAINMIDKSIVRLNECDIDAPVYGVASSGSTLYIYKNKVTGTSNYYRVADDSEIIGIRTGSTADRPNLGESYYCNGYQYYDSEIGKLIYYVFDSPTHWKDLFGNDV